MIESIFNNVEQRCWKLQATVCINNHRVHWSSLRSFVRCSLFVVRCSLFVVRCSFVSSLVRSLVRSFVPPFLRCSFVVPSFVPSFVRSSVRPSIRLSVRPSICHLVAVSPSAVLVDSSLLVYTARCLTLLEPLLSTFTRRHAT